MRSERMFTFLLALIALAASPAPAQAAELIREFHGTENSVTGEFEVRAPWLLDWRVTGELSRVIAVDVTMYDANTGTYEGVVLRTDSPGNGVRLFEESGEFYFRVDASLMGWTLKVYQLTPEEAKQYTPKSGSLLDQ